jgi:hypothetical protein
MTVDQTLISSKKSPTSASPIHQFAMAGKDTSQNLKTGRQKPSRPRNSPNSPRYNAAWPNWSPVPDDNSLRSSMRRQRFLLGCTVQVLVEKLADGRMLAGHSGCNVQASPARAVTAIVDVTFLVGGKVAMDGPA